MSSFLHDSLTPLMRRVFEDPLIVIHEHTRASDVPAWNSFTHMLLITEIENQYKIRFSFEEVRSFACVGDMVNSIEKKLGHG